MFRKVGQGKCSQPLKGRGIDPKFNEETKKGFKSLLQLDGHARQVMKSRRECAQAKFHHALQGFADRREIGN